MRKSVQKTEGTLRRRRKLWRISRFFGNFSALWVQKYVFIGNLETVLRFVQGTNTLVVPCRVSAGGDMSPVSPVDIAPMLVPSSLSP